MGRYNLLDEKWITVLRKDTGETENVSLLTLFEHAVCSLLFIRGKLADELQNYCFFLGGFEEKA